jgi:hypothetical protein
MVRLARESAKLDPKHERALAELEAAASAAVEVYASSEANLGESVDDIKEYP